MDKITIQNLEVFANHGVFPEENRLGQKFLVSAELLCDTRKGATCLSIPSITGWWRRRSPLI